MLSPYLKKIILTPPPPNKINEKYILLPPPKKSVGPKFFFGPPKKKNKKYLKHHGIGATVLIG